LIIGIPSILPAGLLFLNILPHELFVSGAFSPSPNFFLLDQQYKLVNVSRFLLDSLDPLILMKPLDKDKNRQIDSRIKINDKPLNPRLRLELTYKVRNPRNLQEKNRNLQSVEDKPHRFISHFGALPFQNFELELNLLKLSLESILQICAPLPLHPLLLDLSSSLQLSIVIALLQVLLLTLLT